MKKLENLIYETSLEDGITFTFCQKHALALVEHAVEVTLRGTSDRPCQLCNGAMKIE